MVLLGPVGGLVIDGVVSIIIWEALVEDVLEGLATGEGVGDVGSGGLWGSSDHDGKGHVVVVGDILGLVSSSLKDGVEGVVSDDLSEGLEGDGLNGIGGVGWVNLQANSLNLINWDLGGLTLGIEWIGLGGDEVSLGWGWGLGNNLHVLAVVWVVLVVL